MKKIFKEKLKIYYLFFLFFIMIIFYKEIKKNEIKIGLCTLCKQENKYIREFVEHYKKLEVDKIFIYDNNDINGESFDLAIQDYCNFKNNLFKINMLKF